MEPILIVTDDSFRDVAAVQSFSLDLAFGEDEQDFECSFSSPMLKGGELIYIDGTEYGGIVDRVSTETGSDITTYSGRTWHGMLSNKILQPNPGQDYLILSGDANSCIGNVIQRCGLSSVMQARSSSSGINISSYQVDRFANAYSALLKMLSENGARLMIQRRDGITEVWAESASVITDQVDSDVMEFELGSNYRNVNHLVCAGEGELKNRTVVNLYANAAGRVSQTQSLFGVDEVAAFYDYTGANRATLIKDGTKTLQEYQSQGTLELSVVGNGDWHVGDILEARDNRIGKSVQATIVKKIVRVEMGVIRTAYDVGYQTGASSTINTHTEAGGGGIVYTAGDGIIIAGSTISAEVTQAELDGVDDTATNALSVAQGLSSDIAAAVQQSATAVNTANSAITKADRAITAAGNAQTDATNAATVANTARGEASAAVLTANEAKRIAEDAAAGEFLAAYPPGAYFETSDATFNPSIYGGTWERLTPMGCAFTWHRLN